MSLAKARKAAVAAPEAPSRRAAATAPKPEAPAVAHTAVRKKSRAGSDTRGKLLDAAERVFAEQGYDGTSLRDIATRAKLHLALSTYHFGTKEKLFEEVLARRATEITETRLNELNKIDLSKLDRDAAVKALIAAYAMPMFRARYGSSTQWQAHVRLVSQLINVRRWVPLIRKHYDVCGRKFLEKFREVLPEADHEQLLDAFSFTISTMLYVCCYTNRFERKRSTASNARVPKEVIDAAIENFLRFAHAGFMAL